MALDEGWNSQLGWSPLQRERCEGKSNRKHLHPLVEALNMFHVIDLLYKSLIQWEEDIENGLIWVQIQLQHLSCVALDDLEQLSVGPELKGFLGHGNFSAKTRMFPGKRGLLVTPDRLLTPCKPQFPSMKCGYLLPTSLLLTMQGCAFKKPKSKEHGFILSAQEKFKIDSIVLHLLKLNF